MSLDSSPKSLPATTLAGPHPPAPSLAVPAALRCPGDSLPPPFYAWWRVSSVKAGAWVELAFCASLTGSGSAHFVEVSVVPAPPPGETTRAQAGDPPLLGGGGGRIVATLDPFSLMEMQRLLSAAPSGPAAALSPPRRRRPGWVASVFAPRRQQQLAGTLTLIFIASDPLAPAASPLELHAFPEQCARAARWIMAAVGSAEDGASAAGAFCSAQRGAAAADGLLQGSLTAAGGALSATATAVQNAGGAAQTASGVAASVAVSGSAASPLLSMVASGAAAALCAAAQVLVHVADVTQSIPFVGAAAKVRALRPRIAGDGEGVYCGESAPPLCNARRPSSSCTRPSPPCLPRAPPSPSSPACCVSTPTPSSRSLRPPRAQSPHCSPCWARSAPTSLLLPQTSALSSRLRCVPTSRPRVPRRSGAQRWGLCGTACGPTARASRRSLRVSSPA